MKKIKKITKIEKPLSTVSPVQYRHLISVVTVGLYMNVNGSVKCEQNVEEALTLCLFDLSCFST